MEGMSIASSGESTVLFNEKLWPSAGTWIWPLLLALTAGVALAPIGVAWGILAGVIAFVVVTVILMLNTPQITVTEDSVRVGRANIERQYVGEVIGYRGQEAFEQRGQKLHGLAYMNLRGWVDAVVKLEITDPRDQTPYWLTSTRRPEELTRALGGVMNAYRQPDEVPAAEDVTAEDQAQPESRSNHGDSQGQ